MKVEVIASSRVRPQESAGQHRTQQSAVLPAIDSWYAHWRTGTPIYLFPSYNGDDAPSELLQSFSQTINMFPQLTGTLEPCVVDGVVDSEGRPLRRLRLDWAEDNAGVGAEFIVAKTKARIQSLVQPCASNTSAGFLWDRSEESSLRPLFPQAAPKASCGLRVQVTLFRCGGFSLAVDCDHAMADAYTIVLFMRYWGAVHTQMFTPGPVKHCATAELPKIIFDPELVLNKLPKMDDNGARLLQQARQLPTRRPDLRKLSSKLEEELGTKSSATTTSSPPEVVHVQQEVSVSLPPAPASVKVPYMLHLSASGYERATRHVQKEAVARNMGIQVTDQVAIVALVWAALNRARLQYPACSADPWTELHLPTSFRWKLDLPPGLVGSPLVAIMMDGGGGTKQTDEVALAAEIARTLDRFDEEALLAVTYDASLRSTPERLEAGANRGERRERIDFTAMVATGAGTTSFGRGMEPVFFGPMVLQVDDLFMMTEAMPARGQAGAPAVPAGSLSSKWYKDGVNIFFSASRDVVEALAADPAFGDLELVQK